MSMKWITEIAEERDRQNAQWGGPEHDDTHEPRNWRRYIDIHTVRLGRYDWPPPGTAGVFIPSDDYRQRLVKIAALAVAAMESYDRKQEANDEQR
jgi:hypothetical protein